MNTAHLVRTAVAASLLLGAALTLGSIVTMPDFSGDTAAWLQEIAAAPGMAAFSSLTWIAAQLFLAVGLLGVAHLVRSRVPLLAAAASVLVLLSTFGHAVYGGVNLTMLAMARDLGAADVHVTVLQELEAGLAVPFMAAGLLGTVLGFVLLGVMVWRAQLGPRWLGPALVLFVVIEFAGGSVSAWAGYVSGTLFVVALTTLAHVVRRSPVNHWRSAAEVELPEGAPAVA